MRVHPELRQDALELRNLFVEAEHFGLPELSSRRVDSSRSIGVTLGTAPRENRGGWAAPSFYPLKMESLAVLPNGNRRIGGVEWVLDRADGVLLLGEFHDS